VKRKVATGEPGYPEYATLLEIAVLGNDEAGAGARVHPGDPGARDDTAEPAADKHSESEKGRGGAVGPGDREGAGWEAVTGLHW